jgi:hypothetical protein
MGALIGVDIIVVVVIAWSVSALLAFFGYLLFLRSVMVRTGDTAGMRDVAVAVRAFRDLFPTRSHGRR